MSETVLLERLEGGRVALVTLSRPEVLNALNTQMGLDLAAALAEVAEDRRVRAVVLTGAGERAFCAGADLKERQGMSFQAWQRQHRVFEEAARRLRQLPRPVLAAVNGYALGGGCELALSTDFVLASTTAVFGFPEVKRGIMPGLGGTQLLIRRLPLGLALELLMTGESLTAEEAWRCGLVNRLYAPDKLLEGALAVARQIAANSPGAIRQVRQAVRLGGGLPLEEGMAIELECYQRAVLHPDREEGIRAWNERRPPQFADLD